MEYENRELKAGDKMTVAGLRFGKYPNGRQWTTRCWKGKETVLTLREPVKYEPIKPAICG